MGFISKVALGAATSVVKDVAKNVSKNISNNASNSINDAINSKMNKSDSSANTDSKSQKSSVEKPKKPRKKSRTSYKCDFNTGLSQGEFTQIVNNTLTNNPKINKIIEINPPKIKAKAKKGLMAYYDFSVDFNDYGKITGAYWITTDSQDKTIAIEVAEEIKKAIELLYSEKNIDIASLKDDPDADTNTDVSTPPVIQTEDKTAYNVIINKKPMGPFDLSLFEQMVSLGQITCDSLVWKTGMKEWTKASEVDELKEFFSSGVNGIIKPAVFGS